jgi:hypothetical protein
MMHERKVGEPKLSKCGQLNVRSVKVGNRSFGTIESKRLKPGERPEATYWAKDVVRVSERDRGLWVNRAALKGLLSYAVKYVALRQDDGTTYTALLSDLTDSAKVDTVTYKLYLVAPFELWTIENPPIEDASTTLMKKMRIAGRGSKSSVTAAAK